MVQATLQPLQPGLGPLSAPVVDRTRETRAFGDESVNPQDEPLSSTSLLIHSKQYRVVGTLGEGGMGTVYRAYDPVLERDVALKVMKQGLPGEARQRFRQEALFGAKLTHPNLARVYDLGFWPDRRIDWFAMEYLEGRDLEILLTRARQRGMRFSLRFSVDVFDGILDALQHAHDQGLVHRDVKPGNIFVGRQRHRDRVWAKLVDFGVAVDLRKDDGAAAEICGDPRYVAPEQALGSDELGPRTDVYAAGMSLFESLTGRHPFEDLIGSHHTKLLEAQCTRDPPPVGPFLRDLPLPIRCAMDVIVAKACAKDPEDRFESAAAMRSALLEVVDNSRL
ncbi:MAG: serine/threonine protein kinase [Nannocystaceae bacterium]|nr:serine/threonine protein kinase [Nannocystaceae bacterium]